MKKYPLKMSYVAKTAIWAGHKLSESFGKRGEDKISETWELTVRDRERSVIQNGEYNGMELGRYIELCGASCVSNTHKDGDRFPLLIKLIDADDDLSVQVHPDDEYAGRVENSLGKTEMWYIVDAEEGAKLEYGLKEGVTPEIFAALVREGRIGEAIDYIPVKAGESYFIPAGMLHAIGGGIIIAEIQQNADLTYRVYDYDRRGADGSLRELHVDKALDVTRVYTEDEVNAVRFAKGKHMNGIKGESLLAASEFFTVRKYEVSERIKCVADNESFVSLLCVKGQGTIIFEDESYPIGQGDSYFLPAGMGEYSLDGDMEIIDSRI